MIFKPYYIYSIVSLLVTQVYFWCKSGVKGAMFSAPVQKVQKSARIRTLLNRVNTLTYSPLMTNGLKVQEF
jgi:hypothetical protein